LFLIRVRGVEYSAKHAMPGHVPTRGYVHDARIAGYEGGILSMGPFIIIERNIKLRASRNKRRCSARSVVLGTEDRRSTRNL
jgi:hypothetical protein